MVVYMELEKQSTHRGNSPQNNERALQNAQDAATHRQVSRARPRCITEQADAVQQPAGKRAGRGPKHEETLRQVAMAVVVAVVVVAVDVRIVV